MTAVASSATASKPITPEANLIKPGIPVPAAKKVAAPVVPPAKTLVSTVSIGTNAKLVFSSSSGVPDRPAPGMSASPAAFRLDPGTTQTTSSILSPWPALRRCQRTPKGAAPAGLNK